MSLPAPMVPLKDHCSVIHNNTVYAYQSDAFQALPLQNGSAWTKLPMGVSVSGGKCVLATANGTDHLYVVGGATNNSEQDYKGMQSFDFIAGTWTTCDPQISVTQNRLEHAAAFLNASASILVYAGFQDDSYQPTSATFTISLIPPFEVRAYSSDAPPAMSPILLPYNSSHALYVGGSPENQQVWLFSEEQRWSRLDIMLKNGLADISKVQAALRDGSDGSRLLQVFDESASPNTVSTYPIPQSAMSPSRKRKRKYPGPSRHWQRQQGSAAPPYNSTLAPNATRSGFSLAQDPAGLVAITGGNDQSPVAIFNSSANGWVDANAFFNNQPSAPTSSPSPSSPTSSPAASTTSPPPSATTSPAALAPGSGNNNSLIIGATLGSVFGFLALVIVGFLIFKCLRQRSRRAQRRNPSDSPSEYKPSMDFADRGIDGSYGHQPSHSVQTNATASASGPDPQSRGVFHKPGDSAGSGKSFWSRRKSSHTVSPTPQPLATLAPRSSPPQLPAIGASVEPRTEPRTDEGWSRYFANNDAAPTDLRNISAHTSASRSDYTTHSRNTASQAHASAEVPPLNLFPGPSPRTPVHLDPNLLLPYGPPPPPSPPSPPPAAHARERPPTADEDDFYLEGTSPWTPVHTSERGGAWEERPASSVYALSSDPRASQQTGTTATTTGDERSRIRIPNFPGVPSSRGTSQNTVVHRGGNNAEERGLRTMASRDFAGGLRAVEPGTTITEESSSSGVGGGGNGAREGGVPGRFYDQGQLARGAEGGRGAEGDMSWLNLGR